MGGRWWSVVRGLSASMLLAVLCLGSLLQPEPGATAQLLQAPGQARSQMIEASAREASANAASRNNIGFWLGMNAVSGLPQMQRSGAQWALVYVCWGAIEPQPGQFNLSRFDEIAQAAQTAGLPLIAVVACIPGWAAEKEKVGDQEIIVRISPSKVDAFLEFLRRVAARNQQWQSPVKYWEILSEEDNSIPGHNFSAYGKYPEQYADLLKASYSALKGVDPSTSVAFGAPALEDLSAFVPDFLPKVFAYIRSKGSNGSDYFDVMSAHIYAYFDATRWSGPQYGSQPGVLGKIGYVKQLMRQYGISDRPILLTEAGLRLGNPKPDVYQQAAFAVQLYTQGIVLQSPAVVWFALSDREGMNYGILDFDYQPRPGLWAIRYLINKLGGAVYVGPSADMRVLSGRAAGFAFRKGGNAFHVVWGMWDGYTDEEGFTGGNAVVTFPGQYAQVTDMFGATRLIAGTNGTVTLPLDYRPLYVELLASPPPVSSPIAWEQTSATVTPGKSAVISSSNGLLEIDIPANAFPAGSGPYTFRFGPENASVASLAEEETLSLPSFRLEATDSSGNPVTVLNSAVRLLIRYPEQTATTILEDTLSLKRYDPGSSVWTLDGVPDQRSYAYANVVEADVSQLGAFGLVAQCAPTIYLPIISR